MAKPHKIELVRATPPFAPNDYFDRGERIIMVDGVRWGRTIVSHHGCWGTSHSFVQEHGETVIDESRSTSTRTRGIEVRSMNKRRSTSILRDPSQSPWRPTEELVLEKARELVADGRLRHPDVVKAEQDRAEAHYREFASRIARKEEAALRKRACEALGINQDDGSEAIDRVVAAMKWAQTQ